MCYLKPKYFSQARVPDPTKVCVAVGLGFFVELTLDEALAFVAKKDAALNKQVSKSQFESYYPSHVSESLPYYEENSTPGQQSEASRIRFANNWDHYFWIRDQK